MVFSSIPFLFYFLPITLALYYLVPFRAKNIVLLVFSLIFYAWGEPVYILIMLLSICVNFFAGKLIAKKALGHRKLWLWLALIISLGLLGFYKYGDFLIDQVNLIPGVNIPPLDLALPIGISFFTFQALSYSVDVYRGSVAVENSIVNFAAYVSMFPQLIAGPIVRFTTVNEELHDRTITFQGFSTGSLRFLRGIFKKVLLADTLGVLWDSVSSGMDSISVATAWLGIIAFTLQLYFDFSAYSDMAVGMGWMMGFHFEENFNHPLTAISVTDFWRRWHISLSTWFRDYVYIPLGGNRGGTFKHIRNLLIVWMLTGLWHGAAWNFVLWGLYYGVLLILEKYIWGDYLKKLPSALQHLYTLFIVVVGFEFFVFDDFGKLSGYLGRMFGVAGNMFADEAFLYYILNFGIVLLLACLLATPFATRVREYIDSRDNATLTKVCSGVLLVGYVLLFAASLAAIVNNSYSPFLYFRF